MSEMRGRYPGGPSRRQPGEEDGPSGPRPKLATVEEIEARAATGSRVHRHRMRRRRILLGFFLSLILAGAFGIWLGFQSHRTDEELAREMSERASGTEFELDKQADRLINEMWKAEALEKLPRNR